jgi:hypothetical protein
MTLGASGALSIRRQALRTLDAIVGVNTDRAIPGMSTWIEWHA